MNAFLEKIKHFFTGKHDHAKNGVRYFLIVIAFLMLLFFSNDFDLINVQKTAIVMAVGIDRVEEDFSVTTQIAVPGGGNEKGEKSAKTVNVTTRGKTVAEALDKVNEKTGWYPKLVFCRLIVLGESATIQNVFDCLDYFLRDEYITDDCLVAACEGKAEELLSTKTPIDTAGALAIEKVLSNHAQRVGTSTPNTLRLFAASYYGEAACGFLPVVKSQPLNPAKKSEQKQGQTDGQTGGQKQGEKSQGGKNQGQSDTEQEEKTFSASETALFLKGKQIGKLTRSESFLFAMIRNQLRLASYTLPYEGKTYTLTIKRASPSVKLKVQETPKLQVGIALTVGVADLSVAQKEQDTADAGSLPDGVLLAAQETLTQDIHALLKKCHEIHFDLFDAIDKLQKYEHSHFNDLKDSLLSSMAVDVQVQLKKVR